MTTQKVLVTGASGFVATYCIAELLRRDFSVRGTLRDPSRADDVRRTIARTGVDALSVNFVAADLLHDEGWETAMEGCSYVLHVASPFPLREEGDPDDVIRPAREGTLRVLKAATRAGVKRVVQTSSVVAITLAWPEVPVGYVFAEKDWSNPERPDITSYVISKTLAERAAWDFVEGRTDTPELAVVNPGFVLGPALNPDLSTSHEVLRLMGIGAYPAAPKIGFPVSDVRDVAVTHALAMTHPQAAGHRFISANGFLRLIDLGRLMVEAEPDLKRKVPSFEMPDFVVRALAALIDRRLKAVIPDLGHPRPVSNDKATKILDQSFRSAAEAAMSATKSLRELRLI
jgi:nucleoside-diphosphate-sugar epimerase